METTRYAYLHGFASSSLSRKGTQLAKCWSRRGLHMERPDLNEPSFQALTFSGALTVMDRLDAEGPGRWCLIGSSMGGYLAARWAQLHPERVERLVLLCPGFDLHDRWPEIIGHAAMARWEQAGHHMWPDATGQPQPVHWGFIEDARQHPAWPEVPCPTLIIHGTRDETVPIDSSRHYAASRSQVTLVEVDDDHGLAASVGLIEDRAFEFFGLTPP